MADPWRSYDGSNDEGLVDNPMYLASSTTALSSTYEEVPSARGSSRFRGTHSDGNVRRTTQNPIYGVGPKDAIALQHPTTRSLDRMYKLSRVEEQGKGGHQGERKLSYDCLLCLVSLLTVLLSVCSIIIFLLVVFSVITIAHPVFTEAPSPNCSCANTSNGSFDSLMLMLQEISNRSMDVQSTLTSIRLQNQNNTANAEQTVEKLSEQVLALNDSLEAKSDAQMTGSNQSFPAVLSINMSGGCEEMMEVASFSVSRSSTVVDFIDETHVTVDYTCEVEENGTQTTQGVGVTAIGLKPGISAVNITDTFDFLSNAELQCTCYDLRDVFPATVPEFICRHIVLRCQYTLHGTYPTLNI